MVEELSFGMVKDQWCPNFGTWDPLLSIHCWHLSGAILAAGRGWFLSLVGGLLCFKILEKGSHVYYCILMYIIVYYCFYIYIYNIYISLFLKILYISNGMISISSTEFNGYPWSLEHRTWSQRGHGRLWRLSWHVLEGTVDAGGFRSNQIELCLKMTWLKCAFTCDICEIFGDPVGCKNCAKIEVTDQPTSKTYSSLVEISGTSTVKRKKTTWTKPQEEWVPWWW